MAPAVMIDNTPDLDMGNGHAATTPRTLLLAPPSVSSHPDALSRVAEAYNRNDTDIQMLDRLAMGLVALPPATYDVVLILTDIDRTLQESSRLVNREIMGYIVKSMKIEGRLRAQIGSLAESFRTEAILAGLTADANGLEVVKPNPSPAGQTVTLSFGKKKKANAAAIPANGVEAANTIRMKPNDPDTGEGVLATNGSRHAAPVGVGFVNGNDTFDDNGGYDDDSDDEFPSNEELQNAASIDPDTLLTDADRQKPLVIPEACKPGSKRRRACKDCTCGLAQRLDEEDKAKRTDADAKLAKIKSDDLTEVDFTVQGKVGSCGNCALGDAFRCDGCPYIGLPAFKPGEEVRLLNNDVQL